TSCPPSQPATRPTSNMTEHDLTGNVHYCLLGPTRDKLDLADRAVARVLTQRANAKGRSTSRNKIRPPALAAECLLNADAPFQFLLCDSMAASVVHHSKIAC